MNELVGKDEQKGYYRTLLFTFHRNVSNMQGMNRDICVHFMRSSFVPLEW